MTISGHGQGCVFVYRYNDDEIYSTWERDSIIYNPDASGIDAVAAAGIGQNFGDNLTIHESGNSFVARTIPYAGGGGLYVFDYIDSAWTYGIKLENSTDWSSLLAGAGNDTYNWGSYNNGLVYSDNVDSKIIISSHQISDVIGVWKYDTSGSNVWYNSKIFTAYSNSRVSYSKEDGKIACTTRDSSLTTDNYIVIYKETSTEWELEHTINCPDFENTNSDSDHFSVRILFEKDKLIVVDSEGGEDEYGIVYYFTYVSEIDASGSWICQDILYAPIFVEDTSDWGEQGIAWNVEKNLLYVGCEDDTERMFVYKISRFNEFLQEKSIVYLDFTTKHPYEFYDTSFYETVVAANQHANISCITNKAFRHPYNISPGNNVSYDAVSYTHLTLPTKA